MPPLLVLSLVSLTLVSIVRRAAHVSVLAFPLFVTALGLALWGRTPLLRVVPLLLYVPAAFSIPRRLQNTFGAFLLLGVPWLVLFAARGASEAAVVTFYTSGDDWWMFQRYAYRIFMQGYWLEGGQPTFWFQPLYRWIAGALHMLFGDSSVGELCWDASCVLVSALFAFHVVRTTAGFRWGIAAAATTVSLFTLGPAWYLFGRGLSEITSTGLLYAAAFYALRARTGSWVSIVLAGVFATLGFYTRLNNLPVAIAVGVFACSLRMPASAIFSSRAWQRYVSWPVVTGVIAILALGIVLFAARTWYYTGVFSVLYGTQAKTLAASVATDSLATRTMRVMDSLLMVLTMNDPPGSMCARRRLLPALPPASPQCFASAPSGHFRQVWWFSCSRDSRAR